MHFAKHNIFALTAVAMTALSIGAGAAQAGFPTATITIKNETSAAEPLKNYPILTMCTAKVTPEFGDVAAGTPATFKAKSSIETAFHCKVSYKYTKKYTYGIDSFYAEDECRWHIRRALKQVNTYPSVTLIRTNPAVSLLDGDPKSCLHEVGAIEDIAQDYETSNGNFSVTLTIKD